MYNNALTCKCACRWAKHIRVDQRCAAKRSQLSALLPQLLCPLLLITRRRSEVWCLQVRRWLLMNKRGRQRMKMRNLRRGSSNWYTSLLIVC